MKTLTNSLTKQRQAKEEKALRRARRNLTIYKRLVWPRYRHAPHLNVLDAALMECSKHAETLGRDGIGHLIVEMPPRHGKTTTISRLFPTWHLGRNPDHRLILASYGASLAQKNSRYARNVFGLSRYQAIFPHVALDPQSKAADAWNLSAGAGIDYVSWQWTDAEQLEFHREFVDGGADAMGVGGGVTGKGGHIIIVDDPVKSREEAESDTYRQKVWDWFTDDLYTRREPGASVIVVMTRWHQDDLVGRLLANQKSKWHRLRLPAIAEPNDDIGRDEGDALWVERYPLNELRNIEITLGPYSWSALYQQNPVPAEGGVFKRAWFSLVDALFLPSMTQRVRFWDLAMSSKTSADYTVGVLMGQGTDGHIYVLDVKRVQAEWGDVVPYIAEVALADGPDVQIGLEEQAYMARAVQELQQDGRLHQYGVWGYPVDRDKLTRALPFAARCAAGKVSVVRGGWAETYLDEMCSFDKGAHDDQVDASSGAYTMLDGGLFGGGINYAELEDFGAY